MVRSLLFCGHPLGGTPTMTGLPSFLTVDELADLLRCQPEKVYRLAARGELPSYKIEGRRLFNQAEIHTWLQSCRHGLPSTAQN